MAKNAGSDVRKGRVRRSAEAERADRVRTWFEYFKSILFAVVAALILRQCVLQAFRIPTGSMKDTLQIGDFLFVNKFLYGAEIPDRLRPLIFTGPYIDMPWENIRLPAVRQPRQGDIIVFEYPVEPDKDYIKRCVAVAGQRA